MKKVETERKFIVVKPSIDILKQFESYTESNITQTYLTDPTRTHRIRKREYTDGRVEYTENIKLRISGMSAYENEREISEAEYISLSANMDPSTSPVKKTRRTVEIGGLVYEFDSYEPWRTTCIMEVELDSEQTELPIPDFVTVVREVTGVKAYSNHSMAHAFPEEDK